ncbi:hypothetical protein PHYBLDRAFT_157472 [Phycomyces blakesleeanus NRRL 1555(-)]|uniref:Uncharacterized protein n=1 Tax=Phycomyces blakesleeanus (strain ATCC 8743b / DSM 1359 / FGSC 10004 / NBRC 33097 / NRRL 1555) TaxID=763407 RepID=A0A167PLK4_PHYB8|nr:hypothetical protein PHYBLDRAFT_157472 [Phycomyces blakesleeanus NRRL 1555(-)]OAD78169.1 hypothetical protein PHYBLDRAFT_157472 [Phycomyces blakesleeanus NRRL 1555(-)]|eukprot:XP_018296209.1 hypothetical protein PHYBLDRAFT_157472 [Phycomyces blakesleeanus NRRL 1555(-)]
MQRPSIVTLTLNDLDDLDHLKDEYEIQHSQKQSIQDDLETEPVSNTEPVQLTRAQQRALDTKRRMGFI